MQVSHTRTWNIFQSQSSASASRPLNGNWHGGGGDDLKSVVHRWLAGIHVEDAVAHVVDVAVAVLEEASSRSPHVGGHVPVGDPLAVIRFVQLCGCQVAKGHGEQGISLSNVVKIRNLTH